MSSFLHLFDFEGEPPSPTPQSYKEADIYLASRTGDLDQVKKLVEQGVDINRRDFWDSVPLYYACLCGHAGVVKYLLDCGAVCNENTFDGDRCIYGALNEEIVNLLRSSDVSKVPPLKPLARSVQKLCALCDDPEQAAPASQAFDDLCDVEISIGDLVYRLNKVVLASRLRRFDEILSAQPTSDGVHRISMIEDQHAAEAVEVLLIYVYSGRVDLDIKHVEDLRKLAKHYGNPALVELCDRESRTIKYYFKDLKKKKVPKRFILYPYSFPKEASIEHDLGSMRERSRRIDRLVESRLYESSEICVRNDYADGLLVVDGRELRVHLCILCCRSDFFNGFLMSEDHGFTRLSKKTCPLFGQSMVTLCIGDAHHNAVEYLLEYLYTHDVQSLPSHPSLDLVRELFELSDRFLIFEAKRIISERIKEGDRSLEERCELLILADFYSVSNLRDFCLESIACELDGLLDGSDSYDRRFFESFVARLAPESFTDAESLFDSSSNKGSFHGVIDGVTVGGIGTNNILEDLREKYLEVYGSEDEERDIQAADFDLRFFNFVVNSVRATLRGRLSP